MLRSLSSGGGRGIGLTDLAPTFLRERLLVGGGGGGSEWGDLFFNHALPPPASWGGSGPRVVVYCTINSICRPADLFHFEHDERGEIELIQFTAKNTFYNINSGNRHFTYTEGGGDSTASIPEGNYSVTELKTLLQTALNTVATSLTWTVTLNMNTMKYTFSYTGTPAGTVSLTQVGTSFNILGFSVSPTTIPSTVTSDRVISIGNLSSLFIHLDIANTTKVNNTAVKDILAEIPIIGGAFFSTIYWEKISDWSPKAKLPTTENGNILAFSIRDTSGNVIELQDEWQATFRLNVYKTPPISTTDKLLALMIER